MNFESYPAKRASIGLRTWRVPGCFFAHLDALADVSLADWRYSGEAYLRRLAGSTAGQGRGQARRVRLGNYRGVWRTNRHGGLLGGLLGDRYLAPDRLQDEVALSQALRLRGLPTPAILLALAVRRGGFWRQHLVTEEVPEAETVFAARAQPEALAAAAALLERLFAAGLWMPDLHPANLLWQRKQGACFVIDLAGARLLNRPLTARERAARLARFRRYFQKHAGAVPAAFVGGISA